MTSTIQRSAARWQHLESSAWTEATGWARVRGTTTDDLGEYRLGGLPAGRFIVSVGGGGGAATGLCATRSRFRNLLHKRVNVALLSRSKRAIASKISRSVNGLPLKDIVGMSAH